MPTEIELPLIERIIARAELERDPLAPLFEWFNGFSRQLATSVTQTERD